MEHLDVLIAGAGLSGIGAAWRIQEACPTADYAIFEARDAIGGTWDLFRYPGIRSDSDMFTFGYPFRPWPKEESLGNGPEILSYIKETAREGGIDQKIRFHHRIVRAEWSTEDALWTITALRTDPETLVETEIQLTTSFYFSCSGYYRYDQGYTPEFDGASSFEGQVIHPQQWPEDFDATDKTIVVIGSGATAVTLIPSLAKDAKSVTMLQRSPTYIAPLPAKSPLVKLLKLVLPKRFEGTALRWMNALMTQGFYELCKRRPKLAKRMLRKGVEAFLPEGYDIETHFTPKYDPWDQRLCVVPNGDLFTAIKDGKAHVVTDHIDTFTAGGIRTQSGEELAADVIVTATGLELLFIGGVELLVDGEKVDVSERYTYKGMMLEGVPNFALSVGYTNASWTLKSDLISRLVARTLKRMHITGETMVVAVNDSDRSISTPLLNLTSGYVQRSQDSFPKQGSEDPWLVHQSFVRDYKLMSSANDFDEALRFSTPSVSLDLSKSEELNEVQGVSA